MDTNLNELFSDAFFFQSFIRLQSDILLAKCVLESDFLGHYCFDGNLAVLIQVLAAWKISSKPLISTVVQFLETKLKLRNIDNFVCQNNDLTSDFRRF